MKIEEHNKLTIVFKATFPWILLETNSFGNTAIAMFKIWKCCRTTLII